MIDIKRITEGEMDGERVWICDIRYTDYSNKPIRNIEPTEVLVRSNEDTNKRIYYSESHFVGLNKGGKPLKSKIKAPFDGTGYRTYPGIPLNCFDKKEECVEHYREQLRIAINGLGGYREGMTGALEKEIAKLKELEDDSN